MDLVDEENGGDDIDRKTLYSLFDFIIFIESNLPQDSTFISPPPHVGTRYNKSSINVFFLCINNNVNVWFLQNRSLIWILLMYNFTLQLYNFRRRFLSQDKIGSGQRKNIIIKSYISNKHSVAPWIFAALYVMPPTDPVRSTQKYCNQFRLIVSSVNALKCLDYK